MAVALGAAGVVAALVLLALAGQRLRPQPAALDSMAPEISGLPPAAEDRVAGEPAKEAPSAQPDPVSSLQRAAPPPSELSLQRAAPPRSELTPQRAASPPVDAALQRAASPPGEVSPSSPPEGGVVRWVSNWANVRQGRSLESPVLRVLPPGRQVVVANRVNGWWEVYLEGRFAGYIAGSLLRTELPDTSISSR
jgi:hypothetical protein